MQVSQTKKSDKQNIYEKIIALTDTATAASLRLETNIKHRNQVLARRLALVGQQILFIAGFWQEAYQDNLALPAEKNYLAVKLAFSQTKKLFSDRFVNLTLVSKLIPLRISQFGQDSLAVAAGFIKYQKEVSQDIARLVVSKIQTPETSPTPKTPLTPLVKGGETGKVAGVSEKAPSQALTKLLALADTTSRRGQEAVDNLRQSTGNVLLGSSDKQRELSFTLGHKLAKLTLASAAGIGKISQAGGEKLNKLATSANQSSDAIADYNQSGKKVLARETARSLWSMGDLYYKFVDFIIPAGLKSRYAQMYTTPRVEEKIKEIQYVKER
ncbi:hypothetical protein GW884_02605, partial [Candidatus Falkowbacteria bacterium]|nr:hypothetical protein [Candidatus Falkowbacteria bacterium]